MNSEFNFSANLVSQISRNVELFIQQDPGGRGLSKWAINGTLFPACLSLAGGDHIIITTGFYILNSGAIETDGPPGVIILANALIKMGKEVTIITDSHAKEIMKSGLLSVNCSAELITYNVDEIINTKKLIKNNTTHIVALERPGIAGNGLHHNFKGNVISDFVAGIDDLFVKCSGLGIITIGIGDGGNELGMGNVMENVEKYIAPDRDFCCHISSNYCICAGVSNWAGYAAAGILSTIKKENLMLPISEFNELLKQLVKSGAVDGVSGLNEETVDGLPREWEDKIYSSVLNLAMDSGKINEHRKL